MYTWWVRGRNTDGKFYKKAIYPYEKFSPKVMVWGAINKNGPCALATIKGTVDGSTYLSVVRRNLHHLIRSRTCKNFVFQQDNAPCHKKKVVMDTLREKYGLRVADWPAKPPDLSPIENVWSLLKCRVAKQHPRCLPHLKHLIRKEWNKLSKDDIAGYFNNMHRRLTMVVEVDGYPIRK